MGDTREELPLPPLNLKFLLWMVVESLARTNLAVILGTVMYFLSPAQPSSKKCLNFFELKCLQSICL